MKWKNLAYETSTFFITATVTEWQPLFRHEEARNILLADFDFYRRKYGCEILAYMIMPEHYHLIVALEKAMHLHNWLRDLQGHTANELSKWLKATAHPRHLSVFEAHSNGTSKLTVWKEQSRAVGITSLPVLHTKIEYLHANPVRRGLVDDPSDWMWSSWRNYFLDDESVFRVDKVEIT